MPATRKRWWLCTLALLGTTVGLACGGGSSAGSGGGLTQVSVTLTDRPTSPAAFSFLVAYQNGAGAWTLAPAPTGDTYTFPVTASAWGVVWTCIPTGGAERRVTEAHFTTSERPSLTETIPADCTDRISTVALTGTVSNSPTTGCINVHFGNRMAAVAANAYTLQVPPGTRDLVVAHSAGTCGASFLADQVVVVRNLAVTGATMQNVDFTTAQPAQSSTVTIGGGGTPSAQTTLYTANGTSAPLAIASATPFETISLGAAQMMGSDVYDQIITVTSAGSDETTQTWTATPAAQTFAAPPALGGATTTVPTSTPYPELRTTWAPYANAVGYTWTARQTQTAAQCGGGAACLVRWTARLSPGVTGSSPAYQMPDLSALAGWSTRYQLVSGTMVQGSVVAETSSAGAADFPAVPPALAGTSRAFAGSSYTATP